MSLADQANSRARAVVSQKACNGLNSCIEVTHAKLLVRRVQAVVGQSEAHEHRGYAKMGGKLADNRDGTSAPDEHSFTAQNLAEDLGGHANRRMVRIDRVRGTRSQKTQLRFDTRRGVLADPVPDAIDQVLRVLIRHDSHAYFGECFCRDYSL